MARRLVVSWIRQPWHEVGLESFATFARSLNFLFPLASPVAALVEVVDYPVVLESAEALSFSILLI